MFNVKKNLKSRSTNIFLSRLFLWLLCVLRINGCNHATPRQNLWFTAPSSVYFAFHEIYMSHMRYLHSSYRDRRDIHDMTCCSRKTYQTPVRSFCASATLPWQPPMTFRLSQLALLTGTAFRFPCFFILTVMCFLPIVLLRFSFWATKWGASSVVTSFGH